MSAELVTFGCRLNTNESEVMRGHAQRAGLDDAVIVNTCAVTGEAVRQARQTIRRIRRENPEKKIIVTGCAAQTDADSFAAMPEVDRVVGNIEKLDPGTWTRIHSAGRKSVTNIMAVRQTAMVPIEGIEGRARAIVQVQNGCDHRCTFA